MQEHSQIFRNFSRLFALPKVRFRPEQNIFLKLIRKIILRSTPLQKFFYLKKADNAFISVRLLLGLRNAAVIFL